MAKYPQPIENCIQKFTALPGVGRKTAERYTFSILKRSPQLLQEYIEALQALKNSVRVCEQCYNYTTDTICEICRDSQREQTIICIVPEISTLFTIEQTTIFRGLYHVLGGTINHLEGIGADHLRLKNLLERIQRLNIQEVILALNSDMAGEATMLYITQALNTLPHLKISRLAQGLPAGSDIEYADDLTLENALRDRKTINQSSRF